MNRRKLLLGCGVVATGGLAGCTDQNNGDSDGSIRVVDHSLSRVEDAPQKHTLQSYEDNMIVITGTIHVPNACHTVFVTEEPTVPTDSQRIEVTVGSEDTSDDDVACTQAIEPRGYELQIEVEGEPTSVDLTHENANGSETVELSL